MNSPRHQLLAGTRLPSEQHRGLCRTHTQDRPDDLLNDFGTDWEDLMTVTITGSELVVELTNDANEWVIADAIRIQRIQSV